MTNSILKFARSFLFTPGSNPEKFSKGTLSGTDVTVLDIEDSVAFSEKEAARKNIEQFLLVESKDLIGVRMNCLRQKEGIQDLYFFMSLKKLPGMIFVPKVESAQEIKLVRDVIEDAHNRVLPVIAIIESSKALVNLQEIANASDGLIFGSTDFSVDCDIEQSWESLLYVRSQMIVAAGSANIPCIDTAFFDVSNLNELRQECLQLRKLGFRAKAAIHIAQVKTINEIFSPTKNEVDQAKTILKAYEESPGGIKLIGSQMVGPPFVLNALKILERNRFNK